MSISVFDIFKIGIGPSSSHTVGPMKAARRFILDLHHQDLLTQTHRVSAELYGSLGRTGLGHGTDKAVLLGLQGEEPDRVDIEQIEQRLADIHEQETLTLLGKHTIDFIPERDLIFHRRKSLDAHPNGMGLHAMDADGNTLLASRYFSIGGGFVLREDEMEQPPQQDQSLPWQFHSAAELLALCKEKDKRITELMMANEVALRPLHEVKERLLHIWETMHTCIRRGCHTEGLLPGTLKVRRRAPALHRELKQQREAAGKNSDALAALDWVNACAIAVNEENASGGRVVTAPTNGAAGIIPAVLKYQTIFTPAAGDDQIIEFLLTAGAIGMLYKENASISGAEVGCQGEVGVACSMAAAGLTAALGGSMAQVEMAAEIGMEHNLGLTCDPIGGLVQIPCIERNAMGAVKAINATRMALRSDGHHHVSLDKVIATMRQTGADMKRQYKETSLGGLAVNVPEC